MGFVKIVTSGKSTQTSFSNFNVLDVAGGDGLRARKKFPDKYVLSIDIKNGWDVMKKGLPNGYWSVIFANHCIEHFSDPDYFLRECKRVMSGHTVLEIGTPNLAAWFNRILFLFGYVPHSVELSKHINVGKAFDWNNEELGGHIYVYTVPALIQLLKAKGFKIISVEGECSTFKCWPPILWLDKILTKLNPNLASAFRIKCTL